MRPPVDTQLELFRPTRVVPPPPSRPRRQPRPADGLVETVSLPLGQATVSVDFVRHARARCYRLLLRRDGSARVTIPSRGSLTEARAFLQRNLEWLAKRVTDSQAKGKTTRVYAPGSPVWFRGQQVLLEVDSPNRTARLADYRFELRPYGLSLAVQVETALWKLAHRELPPLVLEAARRHGFAVKSVAVRSQRTRWGSCSARAVISLNWRLIQTPDFVRDYIILHELAHLRHLNHSQRYWAEVKRLCPDYERAEAWLKEFGPKVI